MKTYTVAVVGALGLVGSTMVRILEEYDFPVKRLLLLEARQLVDSPVSFRGEVLYTEESSPQAFEGVDIALFATHENVSAVLCPEAAKRGAIAIDNSREFRLDPETPLVVPEVNPDDVKWHKGIIANPNCTSIGTIVVLTPPPTRQPPAVRYADNWS
jgi:aspartate-semialdehyde dehydrogenase